jgi:NAD(P)-dependent dehydrogenase (short-subunit alcohol dehydrogenase family)
MRLEGKVALVVGAGQTPGETVGNGRASAILFAREGAQVMLVDRNLESAEETARMIADEGGESACVEADVTNEGACERAVAACVSKFGRVDVLNNNVGKSQGDAEVTSILEADFDSIFSLNLKSMFLMCKHTLPVMREQQSGSIINISSIASLCTFTGPAYKTSKAGVNSLTQLLAVENGRYGIRVNAILPGLMDTPMAIERRANERNVTRDTVREERDRAVPLRHKMGSGWDVAYAALYLASDEANFVSGAILPVDGAQSARVG